jgi:hypothetical protein
VRPRGFDHMATKPAAAKKPKVHHDVLHLASRILCEDPGIGKLSPQELTAFHIFKHQFLAAGYELYERVSPDIAHPILVAFLKQLSAQLLAYDPKNPGGGNS